MSERPTPAFSDGPFRYNVIPDDIDNETTDNHSIVLEVPTELLSNNKENLTIVDLSNVEFEKSNLKTNVNSCALYDSSNILIDEAHSNPAVFQHTNTNAYVANKRSSNYVFQVLRSTYLGDFMIAAYDFESIEGNVQYLLDTYKTTFFSKSKVSRVIVDHEIYRTRSLNISSERFLQLAKLASDLFPRYLPESFYTPADSSKSSGGAFQLYYGELRRREIVIGRLQPQRKKRKLNDDIHESDELKKIQEQVTIIDDEYVQMWSVTATSERKEIFKRKDLKDILKTLPNLTHPAAYALIQSDFTSLFSKPSELFHQNWIKIVSKIIAIAKTKKADADIKQVLSENSIIKGEEHQKNLALILLPLLFKRVMKITAKSKGKINWTPQKNETLKSFIVHIKSTEKLQTALKDAHIDLLTLYNDHKLIIRPYVVIFGQSLSEIKTAFVVAETLKYQLSSPSEAVDICFQLMKVLDEPYSCICNHVWQFLEKKIYGFEVKSLYASVTTLLEKLA